MAIGPIPPIHPLPVSRTQEISGELPVFDIEHANRTEDEQYTPGGGKDRDGEKQEEPSDEFTEQLEAAEEEFLDASENVDTPPEEEEGSGTVSFLA